MALVRIGNLKEIQQGGLLKFALYGFFINIYLIIRDFKDIQQVGD